MHPLRQGPDSTGPLDDHDAVELRPALAADAPRIARIWEAGWNDAHVGNVPSELVAARTSASFEARALASLGITTVAVLGGEVVGFVMVDDDQVDQLYLDRAARGAGLGRRLLAAGERAVLAAGHRHAWLAVATGNHRARRFYEGQGWIDEGAFLHAAPVPDGTVIVDCHRFVSPPRPALDGDRAGSVNVVV